MQARGGAGALLKPHAYAWEKEYRTGRGRWRGTTNFQLDLPEGSRVLEAGCGNGKHLSALLGKGYDVYAIDISPSAVKLARERAEFHKAKANISIGDVCDLDFDDAYFDAVFAFHVVGHLAEEDRPKAAAEAFRVLKKGGKCHFRGFERADLRYGKGEEVERDTFRRGTNVWVHYFSADEAKRLFEGAGFREKNVFVDRWKVEFRGRQYQRSEIQAVFEK